MSCGNADAGFRLQDQPQRLLRALVQAHGATVSRDSLKRELWPNEAAYRTDENLNRAVRRLRELLGESARNPQFIEVEPGRGYRLLGVAPGPSAPPETAPKSRLVRRGLVVGAAVALVLLAWMVRWRPPRPSPPTTVLTSFDGREGEPALSPDGRHVAFVHRKPGERTAGIYVVPLSGGPARLVSQGEGHSESPTWSPDGRLIAFVRFNNAPGKEIRIVSVSGDSERLFADSLGEAAFVDWSPDGQWLVTTERETLEEADGLYLYSVATGKRTRLTAPSTLQDNVSGDKNPKFSPDGQAVAFVRRDPRGEEVYIQSLDDGSRPKRVTTAPSRIGDLDWLGDGTGLVCVIDAELARVSLESGEVVPLGIAGDVTSVAVRDKRLVYAAARVDVDIWRADGPAVPPGGRAAPRPWITSSRVDERPEYSPEGTHILFTSTRAKGVPQAWICDARSPDRDCRQLTDIDHGIAQATWASSSERFFFTVHHGLMRGLYAQTLLDESPTPVTSDGGTYGHPEWSPDGIYVTAAFGSTRPELWRLADVATPQARAPIGPGVRPQVSNDHHYVYFSKNTGYAAIARRPISGGAEDVVLDARIYNSEWVLWKDKLVYILESDTTTIASRDVHTGETTVLEDLGWALTEAGLSVSPDGRWMLFTKDATETDLMLIGDLSVLTNGNEI